MRINSNIQFNRTFNVSLINKCAIYGKIGLMNSNLHNRIWFIQRNTDAAAYA